jgi:hypothetical protein
LLVAGRSHLYRYPAQPSYLYITFLYKKAKSCTETGLCIVVSVCWRQWTV